MDALYKGFRIETDQPRRHGGEASAPAPFDLFLASLGTCAGIYVLNFCQERSIPTEEIRIYLRTERDQGTRMIRRVNIEIRLPSAFPSRYKEAVVKAAELCTVTKHLLEPPEMVVVAKLHEV